MAQMTDSLAQAILNGAGFTRHEVEQLCHAWLQRASDRPSVTAGLPPLPHTTYNGYSDGSEPLYTAEQMRDYAAAALDRPSDEAEEADYVINRLSTILAGVAIAFKGEELPRHRHSYHDLAELAQSKMLEIALLNERIKQLEAAAPDRSSDAECCRGLAPMQMCACANEATITKDAARYRKLRLHPVVIPEIGIYAKKGSYLDDALDAANAAEMVLPDCTCPPNGACSQPCTRKAASDHPSDAGEPK